MRSPHNDSLTSEVRVGGGPRVLRFGMFVPADEWERFAAFVGERWGGMPLDEAVRQAMAEAIVGPRYVQDVSVDAKGRTQVVAAREGAHSPVPR
jgi:hypothetical protein